MFNNKTWFKDPLLSTLVSLLLLSLNACSNTPQPTGVITVPESTAVVIAVDKDNKPLTILDSKGAPLPHCELCTPELETKYGPKCAQAPKDTICESLTGATVHDIRSVTVLHSRVNPYCYTVCDISGCTQTCY